MNFSDKSKQTHKQQYVIDEIGLFFKIQSVFRFLEVFKPYNVGKIHPSGESP
jgi:hypothetical protein